MVLDNVLQYFNLSEQRRKVDSNGVLHRRNDVWLCKLQALFVVVEGATGQNPITCVCQYKANVINHSRKLPAVKELTFVVFIE